MAETKPTKTTSEDEEEDTLAMLDDSDEEDTLALIDDEPGEAVASAKPAPPGAPVPTSSSGESSSTAPTPTDGSAPPTDGAKPKPPGKKTGRKRKRKQEAAKEWFALSEKKNTSVYVTGMPADTDVDEVVDVFKKAGVIKRDPITKLYRVKLYETDGVLKGDGLVTYLKHDSVDLAVKLLDESPYRTTSSTNMRVTPAQFQQKGEVYTPVDTTERRKAARKAARNQDSMFGWHDVGDENPRTVVLRWMFHPDDFGYVVNLKQELSEDIREELSKLGPIQKLRLFDTHPEGIVTVKFGDSLAAEQCLEKMHGRWFDKRQVEAKMWDGKTDYRLEADEMERRERIRASNPNADDDGDDDGGDEAPPPKKPREEEQEETKTEPEEKPASDTVDATTESPENNKNDDSEKKEDQVEKPAVAQEADK